MGVMKHGQSATKIVLFYSVIVHCTIPYYLGDTVFKC